MYIMHASKETPKWGSLISFSWSHTHMTVIQKLLLVAFYKSTSPPSNFLGIRLYIKGLQCGLTCHPISKMSRMLITSSAFISSSSNDHMSEISNICMFQKPFVAPIYSGFYCVFVLRALRWFMCFVRLFVLNCTYGMMFLISYCPFHAEKGYVIPMFLSHVLFNVFYSIFYQF